VLLLLTSLSPSPLTPPLTPAPPPHRLLPLSSLLLTSHYLCRAFSSAPLLTDHYFYFCTSKAGKLGTWASSRFQYLYFCTSNASKVGTWASSRLMDGMCTTTRFRLFMSTHELVRRAASAAKCAARSTTKLSITRAVCVYLQVRICMYICIYVYICIYMDIYVIGCMPRAVEASSSCCCVSILVPVKQVFLYEQSKYYDCGG
jgi:hypothetical protein